MGDKVLLNSDLPEVLSIERYTNEDLLQPSSGISIGKIKECTATESEVLYPRTFYSGSKDKKVGSMVDRYTEQIASGIAWDESYLYLQPIPEGYYHRITQENWWDPRIKIEKQKLWDLLGGNHGSWGTTINPGGSITIPRGFHNGSGVVKANTIQSSLKSASFNLSIYYEGDPYGGIQEKWWSPGGTVIGMTKCDLQADAQSGNQNVTDIYCEVSNGQVHFVVNYTHRGGWTYAEGTVVYI